jgi:CRP-like cAMP-binding protein
MLTPESRPLNHLLASLPPADYSRIRNHLVSKPVTARQRLLRRGEPLRDVYFPSRSLSSLIITMADGAAAEVAAVGSEGLIGVEAALGLSAAICDATVQVTADGVALAMNVDVFRRELDQRGALYSSVTRYTQAFVRLVTQAVACNGLHSADARCCRLLLHAQDRLATSDVRLTHDLISTMLGVRRPTVTLIIADLLGLGIISTSRGAIRITDRPALEARSCECYHAVKNLFSSSISADVPPAISVGGQSWHEPVALAT